jgi:CheY-like chemotaxis protein
MTNASANTQRVSTLIIDDDVALLDTWTRLAATKGYQVLVASSWDEGLALFHTLSPDLVIADYNLPGSSHGLRLLAEIRRLRPSVRLVLISGAVEPSALDRAESLDVVDRVLSKGDSATARSVVLAEIERASNQADRPTDWRAFAAASSAAAGSSSDDLESIDALLSSNVLSDDD